MTAFSRYAELFGFAKNGSQFRASDKQVGKHVGQCGHPRGAGVVFVVALTIVR